MANPYYERVNAFPRYTTARGEVVQAEYDAVEVGFERINQSFASLGGVNGQVIRYLAGDLNNAGIAATAAQRQNTVQGFDTTGQAVLFDTATLAGSAAVAQSLRINMPLHALTPLPVYGFHPVYVDLNGVQRAVADDVTHMKTAYVVGIPDNNTVDVVLSGFWTATNHGLMPGDMYYLDQVAPGITATPPATGLFQRVCEVWTTDLLLLLPQQPVDLA